MVISLLFASARYFFKGTGIPSSPSVILHLFHCYIHLQTHVFVSCPLFCFVHWVLPSMKSLPVGDHKFATEANCWVQDLRAIRNLQLSLDMSLKHSPDTVFHNSRHDSPPNTTEPPHIPSRGCKLVSPAFFCVSVTKHGK
jgi:hypothetical protein